MNVVKQVLPGLGIALLLLLTGCGLDEADGRQSGSIESAAVIDSVIPIDEALSRFRAHLPRPEGFSGGADSPEALVRRIADLLAAQDTAGFESLALDQAEFAYFYYESNPLAAPPYELPPALMWFQLQQQNRSGVFRMLRELGGREFSEVELLCEQEPRQEGENRVLPGCHVQLDGAPRRLFGALVERGGVWKVGAFAGGV